MARQQTASKLPEFRSSKNVKGQNVKIILWGDTGSRKTETILRNFPKVFLVDTERNAAHCTEMPEIPEFLIAETKNTNDVIGYVDKIAAGEIKFPDGSPIETFAIDSVSVLWGVQTEVATILAEKRAERFNKDASTAATTQYDWGLAKRPLKRLYNRLLNSGIKYVIFTARQKDLYDKDSKDPKIIGVTMDVMRGLDYDVNLIFHFKNQPNGWAAKVEKAQGALGNIFSIGSVINNKIDFGKLFQYADGLDKTRKQVEDEIETATEVAENEEKLAAEEASKGAPKTLNDLVDYAAEKGIDKKSLGQLMRRNGYNEWKASYYSPLVKMVDEHVAGKQS